MTGPGAMLDAQVASLTAALAACRAQHPGVMTDEPIAPGAPGTGLIFADDFTGYPNTAALLTYDPNGRGYIHMTPELGVSIDPTGGIGGKQAVKIAWPAKTTCSDDSHIIERAFAAVSAICVSVTLRYSPGFVFDWLGLKPCVGNAKKLAFLASPSVAGASQPRFGVVCENHALLIGSDLNDPRLAQNLGTIVTPEMLGDGAWHRYTFRVAQSSSPAAADGHCEGWIDGVKRWDYPAWACGASGGYNDFMLPTTFNQGSPVAQAEWIDHLAIWKP